VQSLNGAAGALDEVAGAGPVLDAASAAGPEARVATTPAAPSSASTRRLMR
jgi:hypothetical protein